MIIHDLNVLGSLVGPTETDSELVVYSDAVLTGSIALEGFESVSRRHAQIVQPPRDFRLAQFTTCNSGDVSEPFDSLGLIKSINLLCIAKPESVP